MACQRDKEASVAGAPCTVGVGQGQRMGGLSVRALLPELGHAPSSENSQEALKSDAEEYGTHELSYKKPAPKSTGSLFFSTEIVLVLEYSCSLDALH